MANPFTVQAIDLSGLGAPIQAYAQQQQQQQQQEQQVAKQQEVKQLLERGDVAEMSQYMASNPQLAQGIERAYGFKSNVTKQNAVDTAFNVLSGDDSDAALRDRAAKISQEGGDPSGTLSLLDKTPEERERAARLTLANWGTPQQIKAISDMSGKAPGETKVGAQEILEDGTTIQSTQGGINVYNPQGELVKGQAAADAIKQGRAEKVSNLRKAAGEKKMATLEAQNELEGEVAAGVISKKEGAKASIAAFDKIEKVNESIALYDEGIKLIDEGAETGKIDKLFPSFRAASIKLDNLGNRLGLDVVGNTTFGALSAGELSMAMSTALPTGLDGPDLKDWLIEKRDAQVKLADYLESAAIYLGTPGNTKVGWLKKKKLEKRQKQQQQPQAPQGAIDYLTANPQAAEQFKAKFGYLPEGL